MLLLPVRLLPLLLAAAAAPAAVRYDQRQDGDFNVHAHLENFVVVLIPTGGGGSLSIGDLLKKAGAGLRTAEQPLQVAVVKARPEDQPPEAPAVQQQREAEDLQPAAAELPPEAVLVAESPAIVLARQPPEAAAAAAAAGGDRAARAVGAGGDVTHDCPRGHFRDATGVCHEIGTDRRIDDGLYLGLMPPLEK